MVTRAEAERIIAEPKVIGANLSWKKDGQGQRLEAKVLCEESGEMLVLRGYQGKRNRSFALLYRNEPIRKYTVHSRHIDPVTRERVTDPPQALLGRRMARPPGLHSNGHPHGRSGRRAG